jgi:peptidoglycan/xylan/chitin deacetylase (PgdA/CDA1 family)
MSFKSVFPQNSEGVEKHTFDVPVFVYHRFGDDRYPSTNISIEIFRFQLQYLTENNYRVMTLGEIIKIIKNNSPVPQKVVVLTVDDGYKCFKTGALPLLNEFGFCATIFIQTETVGGNDYLDWDEIKEISEAGIEIGNHSQSHNHFLNSPKDKINIVFKNDLETSEDLFKNNLGFIPEVYAYPYGEYVSGMEQVLEERKYLAAAAQNSGVLCDLTDKFAIPRFPMGGVFASIEGFIEKSKMKALRVIKCRTESPVFDKNPPELIIEAEPGNLNFEYLKFFVHGSLVTNFQVSHINNLIKIVAMSDKTLKARRTLYTLTAPSKSGDQWYWYSHLWIQPGISE